MGEEVGGLLHRAGVVWRGAWCSMWARSAVHEPGVGPQQGDLKGLLLKFSEAQVDRSWANCGKLHLLSQTCPNFPGTISFTMVACENIERRPLSAHVTCVANTCAMTCVTFDFD